MTNTISLLLYGASFSRAVTLKSNSYSAEQALVKLDEQVNQFNECLCFRYKENITATPGTFGDIEDGGFIEDVDGNGECVEGIRPFAIDTDGDGISDAINGELYHYTTVTNQSCLYKLWMCACWSSQTPGCLCARENSDDSVTMVKPLMGQCPVGTGPLLNPKAQDTGGYALQCAPNPCLACCSCSKGICTGNGDPADDDLGAGTTSVNCCDCCGANGGYVCALGGSCNGMGPSGGGGQGGGAGGYGDGGGCGCGGGSGKGGYGGGSGGGSGGGGYGSGGGGGCGITQNVNTCC